MRRYPLGKYVNIGGITREKKVCFVMSEVFRHDNFLSLDPRYSFDYDQWLRGFCKRLGGFEPNITAAGDSAERLAGMAAAGRGIFVGAELAILAKEQTWGSLCDYYPLTEPDSYIE
jgi:DNA-binding transcriptional LysR family regulator